MFWVYRHRMECLAWKGSPCFNNANVCLPISGDNEDFPPLFFFLKVLLNENIQQAPARMDGAY